MRADDLRRELGKALEALRWTEKHLMATNEGNAALHCNPKVFYSPLTTQVHEAVLSLERVTVDLGAEAPPSKDTIPVASHLEAAERAQQEIERLRVVAGRAYLLADRWEAAHGSAMFLVRAAGAELRDVLDDSAIAASDVVHSARNSQASQQPGVDESRLECVCGDPVEWMAHRDEPGWIHSPGSDTKCLNARPRCPECQMPHLLVPGRPPMRRFILKHLDGAAAVRTRRCGEECSEGHTYAGRCEQAGEHGPAASSCSNPDHACVKCGDCAYEHPGEGGCTVGQLPPTEGRSARTVCIAAADQGPPNQGPLSGIEVRDPCPYCTGGPLFPRSVLGDHIEQTHSRVLSALARGVSLDEVLHQAEMPCDLPHEMEV